MRASKFRLIPRWFPSWVRYCGRRIVPSVVAGASVRITSENATLRIRKPIPDFISYD
ncbi:hypothetical protein [Capnocytophaga sp.]|uniref:hypothetical protein n=1 Tax=Capnocytophaga sp. TaxID=44737 RepID=UPI0026DCF586|nr:hypothetical protein [Capnocytophaga sp.]MDO5105052.1 hypothetical protein [Capnocytophaga sp.]